MSIEDTKKAVTEKAKERRTSRSKSPTDKTNRSSKQQRSRSRSGSRGRRVPSPPPKPSSASKPSSTSSSTSSSSTAVVAPALVDAKVMIKQSSSTVSTAVADTKEVAVKKKVVKYWGPYNPGFGMPAPDDDNAKGSKDGEGDGDDEDGFEGDEDACPHPMLECNCEIPEDCEDPDDLPLTYVPTSRCDWCSKKIPKSEFLNIKRMARVKGGFTGTYCCWDCVEAAIEPTGGNTIARYMLLAKMKAKETKWLNKHTNRTTTTTTTTAKAATTHSTTTAVL